MRDRAQARGEGTRERLGIARQLVDEPRTPSAANSVTALVSAGTPRSTCERLPRRTGFVLGEAERVLAGLAERRAVDLAGAAAADVADDELSARPIVALARLPCPSALTPEFMPMARAIGPFTTTSGPENQVVASSRAC